MDKYSGYIEGYFGRELTWPQRFEMLDHLQSLSLNTFLYAPKEDPYHRIQWKVPYPAEWQKKLRDFAVTGREKGVEVVPALGPGMSFCYSSDEDYQILIEKFKIYFQMEIYTVALLMDDISPELPSEDQGNFKSLGQAHGQLLQRLLADLKQIDERITLWFCPTIYTDEFVEAEAADCEYIKDLAASIPAEVPLMWTGTEVVAESLTRENIGRILHLFKNNVIIWDNYYANDYATQRLFIGTYDDREPELIDLTRGMMINPTGLFETDRFLLALLADFLKNRNASIEGWTRIAREFGVPEYFDQFKSYFWSPFQNPSEEEMSPEFFRNFADIYDGFIVPWQGALKMEWFPYIYAFHLDLQFISRSSHVTSRWVDARFPPLVARELKKLL